MATLVSTGQITIVDNNDAKPITAYITNGSQPLQQIYTKNDTVVTYIPSRSTNNLVLTAKVYAGSTTDIADALTNPKWTLTPGGSALTTVAGLTVVATVGSTPTLTISDNTQVTTAAPNKTIYFEGDYQDPVTGLLSHVICQTTLSLVQTGTNAVYLQFVGPMLLDQSTGATKETLEIRAELIRSSGIDTDNLSWRWSQLVSGVWTQIDTAMSGVATKFGFRTMAQADADDLSASTTAMLNVAVPSPANWTANTANNCKGIVISETAVATLGFFKCEINDTNEGKSYTGYFTVSDKSDPYKVELISSSGEKLQNGVGSTDIWPVVYNGSAKVTDLTSWTFDWQFWAQDLTNTTNPTCYRAAFIDVTRTAQAGGRALGATPNTAGTSAVITYGGAVITFASGDIIKIVKSDGKTRYYEVASGTGNTVTIRTTATVNTWLNSSTPFITTPTLNEFANGYMYVCHTTKQTSGANNNDLAAKIVVTGSDIDVKGNIICDANRP